MTEPVVWLNSKFPMRPFDSLRGRPLWHTPPPPPHTQSSDVSARRHGSRNKWKEACFQDDDWQIGVDRRRRTGWSHIWKWRHNFFFLTHTSTRNEWSLVISTKNDHDNEMRPWKSEKCSDSLFAFPVASLKLRFYCYMQTAILLYANVC